MWPLRLKERAQFDVVGVGGNTDDHLCVVSRPPGIDSKQPLADYLRQPGGQVPTALVALQRWGARTAYVGVFGDDGGGAWQRASLIEEGVDVSAAAMRATVGSRTSVILIDQISGARTVLWHQPSVLRFDADEIARAHVEAGRVLLLDDENLDTAMQVARWARAAGVVVVLDVDSPQPETAALVALADIVIVSDGFPQRLTGASDVRSGLRTMGRRGATLSVVTLGAGGALALCDGEVSFVRAFPVPVVDTTSAGDVFHAGVMHGVLQRWPLADTLSFASAAAALECTALGGRAAIPSLAAVQKLVSSACGVRRMSGAFARRGKARC